MSEKVPKKPEHAEGEKPVERTKISDTAKDSDQTEKFRAMRRQLATSELAFSFTTKGVGSKFELTDGSRQIAAATGNRTGDTKAPPLAASEADHPNPAGKPLEITAATNEPVDVHEAQKDAEAIRKATGNDNYIARWADKDAINKILEGKTDAERKAIDQAYQQKYGHGLEKEMKSFETGSDLDKFLNILNRKDNNPESQAARRIHQNLLENHNLWEGRSSDQIEKDVRDLLSTRNSGQVAKMEDEYRKTYGISLKDAIASDTTIKQSTKDMAAIYLKGNDKRTDQDTAQLISTALKNKNTDLFAESMRDASPSARKAFLENGGESKVIDSFGHWYSNSAVSHAMDYAREGKLSAATQIKDNTGLVFDNEKGIELAVKRMTDNERKMYVDGKAMSDGKPVVGLSADSQREARQYYSTMHDALSKSANATELIKYEDMIANKGDGSLVASLARHRGILYNSSSEDITNDIRNMTPAQFDDSKQHPARRAELQDMLKSLNKGQAESDEVLKVYDRMMAAPDLAHAQDAAKTSLTTEVVASQHWYGTDSERILNSISNMSTTDQNRYSNDVKFRGQLDHVVKTSIEDPREVDAARRMLQQVKDGKAPDSDIVARLERIRNYDGTKTAEAVREVENSFRAEPALRDRVINPKTDDDKKFADQFAKAVNSTFGDDFENYGKPLLEAGRLPLERKVGLNEGVLSNDYKQSFEDLQQATPEEKKRLKEDSQYREKVLGFMDENRRQIAIATLDQTVLKPQDNIRAAIVGWGGSADIVEELKKIKPEELDAAKADYARKYGTSLEGDLMHKLGGQDRDQAERVLTQNLNVEERASIVRNQTENARSGVGAAISDNVFQSATGEQADDAQLQMNRAMSERNKTAAAIESGSEIARNMSPEQIQQLQKRMSEQLEESIKFQHQATDNNVESKKTAAEYTSNTLIMVGAVGSLIATGGADAPLVIGLAVAGGGIKVGTNMALQGNNYDLSIGQVATDAGIGSIEAATAVIGPGEIAAVLGIGKVAATEAAGLAVAQVGEQVLISGGKEALENGTREIVTNALASGAKELNPAEFTALAEHVVSPALTGAARKQAVKELSASLEKNVVDRMATGVVKHATQHGLNAAGGALGGGASGIAEGVTEYDSRKSAAENLANIATRGGEAALGGAITGGAVSIGSSGLGRAWQALRGTSEVDNVVARDVDNVVARDVADAAKTETVRGRPEGQPEVSTSATSDAPPGTIDYSSPGGPSKLVEIRKPPGSETPGIEPTAESPGPITPTEETEILPPVEPKPAADATVEYRPAETASSRPLNESGQVLDSKGNVLEHHWPKVEANKVEAVRAQVREELGQVKASDGASVAEKLDASGMSEAQKKRVLDALGEVREHYARTFNTDVDQSVNWIHTQGELGRVIDAAKAAGLSPAQTEDAMLASMFSDSLKTKANFTTHHLDGELAAEHILKEKLGGDFTQERLDGILHAIKEHQIAPPAFMAMIYGGAIRRSIAAEGRQLTAEETGSLTSLLAKMSDPLKQATADAADGGKMLKLTDAERTLLERTGSDKWYVPSGDAPWNKISRALIDGDGIDNYATPGGLSKIIQIRGPESGPFFKDGNLRYENPDRLPGKPPSSSQESWRDSFDDFAKVASPDGLKVARAATKDAERESIEAQRRVNVFLREKLGIPPDGDLPTIPGWTGKPKLDAEGRIMTYENGRTVMQPDNLKYPDYEPKWWDIHAKPAARRTPEEEKFYEDPANRYRGLNEQEIKDFKLAKEIRDRYAAELRKGQRVAGDAAPNYQPVAEPAN